MNEQNIGIKFSQGMFILFETKQGNMICSQ